MDGMVALAAINGNVCETCNRKQYYVLSDSPDGSAARKSGSKFFEKPTEL